MPTKQSSTRRNLTAMPESGEFTPWNFMADLSRQQMANAMQTASAMFRCGETMRKIQQEAAHEASIQHAIAAERLQSPCDPSELLSIQSDLMRFDMQRAAEYWQQLMSTAVQSQVEIMGTARNALQGEPAESMRAAMEAFQASLPANGAQHAQQKQH